jgi:hypothetical protein
MGLLADGLQDLQHPEDSSVHQRQGLAPPYTPTQQHHSIAKQGCGIDWRGSVLLEP